MKKTFLSLIFGLAIATSFVNVSCTNEKTQSENVFREETELAVPVTNNDREIVFYVYFNSDSKTKINWSAPSYFEDAQMKRPVTLNYWECGDGVYTNGIRTYHMNIVEPGTVGAYMIVDHSCECVYWVTTSWGGSCGG